MKNETQLRLFLVVNPVPFERFEDHRAAIEMMLVELIEIALKQKENPISLIEEYLNVTYNEGNSVEEIARYLANSGAFKLAMGELEDNWDVLDTSLPEESIEYVGTSKKLAHQVYGELSLRTYLESLAQFMK